MGIKDAYNEMLAVLRRLYGTGGWQRHTRRQVSGHLYSETKLSFLPSPPHPHRGRETPPNPSFWVSQPQRGARRLRGMKWVTAYLPGIRLAGIFPGCAPKKTGRRSSWQRSCNSRAWMSAETCSPALSCALPGSTSISCWVCNGCSVFPSSGFSQTTFKTWTRYLPKRTHPGCPNLILQRNPGANAKS